jgi:hypothetical protein
MGPSIVFPEQNSLDFSNFGMQNYSILKVNKLLALWVHFLFMCFCFIDLKILGEIFVSVGLC